jgi:phosphoribosylamine--glycine ligase/phosphoribosylformylglycinamidine cyclo-ligase
LAYGKGVFLPDTMEEADNCLGDIFIHKVFKEAGDEVIIEERLEGEEVSILAFCDGYTAAMLPAVQDHKRIFDNDQVGFPLLVEKKQKINFFSY